MVQALMKAVGNFNLPFACKTIKLKLFMGYLRTVSPYNTQQSILFCWFLRKYLIKGGEMVINRLTK